VRSNSDGDRPFDILFHTLIQNPRISFLIVNDGYTIERHIHGMEAEYNDVVAWKYKDLVGVFTPISSSPQATGAAPRTYQVRTVPELEKLLTEDADFATGRGLRFVELYMPREDAPASLKMTAEASAKRNAE